MAGSDSKRVVTQFHFKFDTGDTELDEAFGTYFTSIRIINSMRAIWPIIQIRFNCDNQVFIEKDVFGATDIDFIVWWTGDTGDDSAQYITYTLLYLEANVELPPKEEHNDPMKSAKETQKRYINVSYLAKPAYLTMSSFVNRLWEEETQMRPVDFVYDILEKCGITDYRILEDGVNQDTVQQMVVPPMTLRASVDYINQNYGIYSGPMLRYANYAGQFLMWDVKQMYEKHKDSPWITFHKSPSHFETPGLFEKINLLAIQTDDNFVTYDNCETLHYGNANVIRYGYDNIYIYHPHEDIAQFMKIDLEKIVNDFGLWHNDPLLKFDKDLKNRKLYFSDMQGFETGNGYSTNYSDFILSQDMSTCFQDSAAVKFNLYRNIKFPLCSKIGEVLYFQPYSDHEKFPKSNFEGAYMVSDSDVIFTKEENGKPVDNINAMATLIGYRTAQSKD